MSLASSSKVGTAYTEMKGVTPAIATMGMASRWTTSTEVKNPPR